MSVKMIQYPLPSNLQGKCKQEDYTHWLRWKAHAHVKRDTKRGNRTASAASYRDAIHRAVCKGGDRDAYTGRPLRWDLIRKYNNKDSKKGKRAYKKRFADLPTVDHEDDGLGKPKFKMCSWRTNDCKNDLTVRELLRFCEQFLAHQKAKLATQEVKQRCCKPVARSCAR